MSKLKGIKKGFKKLLKKKRLDTTLFGISATTGAASLGVGLSNSKKYNKLKKDEGSN